ncbi:MAG: cysteine desulfurase [Candidatus Tokpelaia sp.]|nr:MAG: cysteine desulfurase [Candidatus Tokpelaia sp.]KAA6207813.1 MAG: cysteine desulfurase [Candidatus Tokpelaia sp.]
MVMERLYLDYNATAPLTPGARQAVLESLDLFGNASSVHSEGRTAYALVQKARQALAALVQADSDNIVFTSGATEAAATLLTPHYTMGRKPLFMSRLYIGATEHPAIAQGGFFAAAAQIKLPVDANGQVLPEKLAAILAGHDKKQGLPLVAVQYANHETGIIQPVAALAEITRQAGGLLVADAVQALGKMPLDIKGGGADFLIVSAHKIGGLKGAGAYIASGSLIRPQPLMAGGGQEKGLRGGTVPVQALAAFGAAATNAAERLKQDDRSAALQSALEQGLKKLCPDCIIYGEKAARLSNTTYFSLPSIKAETLQIAFDLAGIATSSGAACSSGKVGASPVLAAMGARSEQGALRVSTGPATKPADIARFLQVLQKILVRKAGRAAPQ